jgi:hypothetical protein
MPIQVIWIVDEPNTGLGAAMQHIAHNIADEGDYSVVEILYVLRSFSNFVTSFES